MKVCQNWRSWWLLVIFVWNFWATSTFVFRRSVLNVITTRFQGIIMRHVQSLVNLVCCSPSNSKCLKLVARANFFNNNCRTLFSETGTWDTPFLTQAARLKIEELWKDKIAQVDKQQVLGYLMIFMWCVQQFILYKTQLSK